MTSAQWAAYVPGQPYQKACTAYPRSHDGNVKRCRGPVRHPVSGQGGRRETVPAEVGAFPGIQSVAALTAAAIGSKLRLNEL
jgi:hypothetical protein